MAWTGAGAGSGAHAVSPFDPLSLRCGGDGYPGGGPFAPGQGPGVVSGNVRGRVSLR